MINWLQCILVDMDNILLFYKTFSALILCSTFWMQYAKWFWGSSLKIVNFFLLCSHYLLLKKVNCGSSYKKKWISFTQNSMAQRFWRRDRNCLQFTDRQTMDNLLSERLTWVFNSAELNTNIIWQKTLFPAKRWMKFEKHS